MTTKSISPTGYKEKYIAVIQIPKESKDKFKWKILECGFGFKFNHLKNGDIELKLYIPLYYYKGSAK